jgi:glycine/D-amino acid oxidase-like deaminating enzyme
MLKADYLIVGQGIAGSVMALTLVQQGRSVAVLSRAALSSSSRIAAGVYNPFNFRRSVPVWEARKAVAAAREFYTNAERITTAQFHRESRIVRLFGTESEREEWETYLLQDTPAFAESISVKESFGAALAPFGSGILSGGGMLRTSEFLSAVCEYFTNRGYYFDETCNHELLSPNENGVVYDGRIGARHVIFCEGHLAGNNPYFDTKVVAPTKGELLHVSVPGFNQAEIINGQVYVAPLGGDEYVCGATFNPGKADEEITDAGREELLRKLRAITGLPVKVTGHFAGVRPAGRDRKPVLGRSRTHRNFSIFNGFGSKAVLMSPLLAQMLANHLENDGELAPEVNVARFKVY